MKSKQASIVQGLLKAGGCASLALVALKAHGQSYGSIAGSVTDNTGAAIPNAAITLTNDATSEKRTEKATSEGTYRIINLLPGTYHEDVEVSGFKHFTRENITVDPETAYRVDVSLTVGSVGEVVEVTSEAPLLQTDSPTLQQVVGEKAVQEMPLNGRNVMNLIAITPGVVAQGGTAGAAGSNQSAGHTNNLGWNNYQIGGGMPGQAAQFLDGAPLNGLGANEVFLIPNQDSISEFRVGISTVTADFGRYGGGVVNFTSKSGGNQWHGSAYEYFRNKALNAATYFGKRSGAPKAAFNQNQFGGTFGGKIIRDKAFFVANYEQYKIISGATFTAFVPTVAQRGGNFGSLCANGFDGSGVCLDRNSSGQVIDQIYDPYTTVASGTSYTRTPFANNVIPTGRLDYTANQILNVLQYYPAPNTTAGGSAYNFAATREPAVTSKQGGIRLDWNVSQKQHLFGRYTQWELHDIPVNNYGGITGGAGSDQLTKEGVLGDTYTFGPKLTADLRVSYARSFYDDNPPSKGFDLGTYGPAWASIGSQVNTRLIITPSISGYGAFNGAGIYDTYTRDTYAVEPSVNYLLTKHNLKFGADDRLMDLEYVGVANPFTFNFTSGFTSYNGSLGGNALASMLLGAVSTGTVQTAASTSQYNWYQGYYLTDTWQPARKLSVSMGLRYELPGAFAERKNKATVLLPNALNSLGTVGGYTLKNGLFLVDSPNWGSRTTEQEHYTLFAPRVGVSYNPVENTVLRAGYGITYIPFDAYDGAAPFNSPINTATTTMVTSVNNANQVPLNTFANPLPAGGTVGNTTQSVLQPVGRNQTYLNNLAGLNISGPVPQVRFPYAQQWTASIEQQMSGDALLQIAYAGTRGTFLPLAANATNGSTANLNQLPDQYLALGSGLTATRANPFAGKLNSTGSLNGANVTQGQLYRPFPEYGNVVQTNAQGDNIYHSLQVSLQKRFAAGGLISGNYTWAKNIGDVSGTPLTQIDSPGGAGAIGTPQDWTNLRGERTVLNTDIRNRGLIAFVSPLPIGKGHTYFKNLTGVAGGFVNGWEVNGIITFQSGYPLSLVAQSNTLNTSFGYGTIRPNYSPTASGCINGLKQKSGSAQSRLGGWFNTACFAQPADFTLGNEPRVDTGLHGAGIANYDFSASKNTGITEGVKLQLKAEMFNLFNRVQFALPGATVGTPSFGTIAAAANQPRQVQLSARLLF